MQQVICLTEDQYPEWDKFVESSPQGTIFSTTRWLELLGAPYNIYGYYKNGNLLGGFGMFDTPQPLTPFQGILVCPTPDVKYANVISLHNEVATALLDVVPDEFSNHYMYDDIRPFLWAGWKSNVKYTYVVELDGLLWGNLEKQTRYEVTKARRDLGVEKSNDIQGFNELYGLTFERKAMDRPINSEVMYELWGEFCPQLYMASDCSSGALVIKDNKRAYYILGASNGGGSSSLTLWATMEDLTRQGIGEIDLVGCNDRNIALFKRGFGGILKPYYGVCHV